MCSEFKISVHIVPLNKILLGKGRSHGGGGSEATEPISSAIVKYNYQVVNSHHINTQPQRVKNKYFCTNVFVDMFLLQLM